MPVSSSLAGGLSAFRDRPSAAVTSCLCIAAAALTFILWKQGGSANPRAVAEINDAVATDPGLLKKFSVRKSYHVPSTGFTYSLRIFYREHSQADKLPTKPTPLPLLTFIHGLGGSVAQFGPLLTTLVNVGPCLAIDLPGCGRSDFQPWHWDAYTHLALAELVSLVIKDHLKPDTNQGTILVAHSMGCSLATTLASTTSNLPHLLAHRTLGIIAICPKASSLSPLQQTLLKRLISLPSPIFDLLRLLDKRGGPESASVRRMVGAQGDAETKRLQLRYNAQSQTPVWRRMTYGFLVNRAPAAMDSITSGYLNIWSGVSVPTFLVAGADDTLAPPDEVEKIGAVLRHSWGSLLQPQRDAEDLSTTEHSATHNDHVASRGDRHVQNKALTIAILPSPASHAVMYAPDTCRILSGLIQDFIAKHVDQRLALGWQLQHLSTEGKWDVKNLEKWKKIEPVSSPIGGIFRAMKTMREVDDMHSPQTFAESWRDSIWVVCDISHETPVYDPANLKSAGVEYVKFPTVSKLPPTEDEVAYFLELVDQLRKQRPAEDPGSEALIAIHCHYGFNRTGYFIVCYLVEREGWSLHDALEEFSKWRPPGIKHAYFVDALFARYCAGLRRASVAI